MIEDYCVTPETTILVAMKKIDQYAIASVVVCRSGVVDGILTDGDVRRAIIRGAALTDQIDTFYTRKFVSVSPGMCRADVLDMMQARSILQIPIVREDGTLHGIHTLHKLLGCDAKPNWAVIMAGGKGTRLGSLTTNMPKPMLKVAGRPILERIILHLVSHGIKTVFLSVNYLGYIIEEYFGDGERLGCKIEYLREDQPLGTGGALSLLPEKPEAPVLVMNGDLVMQTNFNKMLDFHIKGAFYATMGLRPYVHEVAFGCVASKGDQVVRIEEKPVFQMNVNAGVYVLSPEAIKDVPSGQCYPITELFEAALRSNQRCGAYMIEEDWMDIGQPSQLMRANGKGVLEA